MTGSAADTDATWLRSHPKGCTLVVRIQPGAKRSAVLGVHGEGEEATLKIAIQAPPIEGRANEALIAFVAARLDLPRSAVELLRGQSSRSKTLLIRVSEKHGDPERHALDPKIIRERLLTEF